MDLDGTRGASRRSSIADVIGPFESIAQPLKSNGHQPPSPEPEAEVLPKVPKSMFKAFMMNFVATKPLMTSLFFHRPMFVTWGYLLTHS